MESADAPHDLGTAASPGAAAPLNGTLEDYSPAGVLQVLSSQRETGAVRFSGEAGCTVYLHEGQLYFAETATTGEALAVALVRPGRLTPDEWDDATQAGYPTSEVGQELLNTGAIDRELLASVVLSIIYDPLIHLFRQGEGAFEFEPGTIHWMGPFRTFDLDAIVAEVRRRVREADEMAEMIPHLGMFVTAAPTLPADRGSVNLRRDDWEVAIATAGGRRIDDLAVELGRGQWSTARLVYRLATAGLLDVGDAPDEAYEPPLEAYQPVETHDEPAAFQPVEPAAWEGTDANDSWATGSDAWADAPATDTEPAARHGLADAFGDVEAPEESIDLSAPDDAWATPPPLDTSMDWATPGPQADDVATTDSWGAATDDSWGTAGDGWEPEGWSQPTDAADVDSGLVDEEPAAAGDHGISFDMPNLHPDIAKALAESTYADSATAINAMAARLGAAAEDDADDDWDAEPDSEGSADQFWGTSTNDQDLPWGTEDADEGTAPAAEGLSWAPSSWDTGVEAVPLPHRERSFAEEPGPVGPADPEWLENLYAEFMSNPAEDGTAKRKPNANPVEAAFAASPEVSASKNKTLRRVISAIRRL